MKLRRAPLLLAARVLATLLAATLWALAPALADDPEAPDDPAGIAPPAFTLPDDPEPSIEPPASADGAPPPHRAQPDHVPGDTAAKSRADAAKPDEAPSTPQQREKLLAELYARLEAAPDEQSAAPIALAIEQVWAYSGSPTADLLVQRAMAMAQANRQDLALELLTAAVELQPDYAEAWNRRAFLYYLMNDTERALGDLRRVLALEPKHYKALDGLASILQNSGDKKNALKAYDSLLKVYPAMPGAKTARDELIRAVEGQGI